MKKLLVSITTLLPATVLAHTGHIPNDAAHGFLHIEHIVIIAAISLVIYAVSSTHNK